MRVVIAKKLLSTVGGSEAQARALARALAKRHHDVTLVGLRPAWRRPGIPLDVYAAPPGPVELRHEGVRFLFLPVRGGRVGAALDGILPTSLVSGADLEHAVAGADIVHPSRASGPGRSSARRARQAPHSSKRRSSIPDSASPEAEPPTSRGIAATTRSSP